MNSSQDGQKQSHQELSSPSEGLLKFTNNEVVIKKANSQTIYDGTIRDQIMESEIINKQTSKEQESQNHSPTKDDGSHQSNLVMTKKKKNDEDNIFTSQQGEKAETFQSHKQKIKKKWSLNIPLILETVVSNELKDQSQIPQLQPTLVKCQSDQSILSIRVTSPNNSPQKVSMFSIPQTDQKNYDSSKINPPNLFKPQEQQNVRENESKSNEEKIFRKQKQENHKNSQIDKQAHQTPKSNKQKRQQGQEKLKQSSEIKDTEKENEYFKQIYSIPIEIPLPKQKNQFNIAEMQVEYIVPCTIIPSTEIKKEKKLQKGQSVSKSIKINQVDESEQSIIVAHGLAEPLERYYQTDELLDKINCLEKKIQELEAQKKREKFDRQFEQNKKDNKNEYSSTPEKKQWNAESNVVPGNYGMIRKNEIKNYASNETHQTSQMFKMKIVSRTQSHHKINSNIFNIALSEQGSNTSYLKEEIEMLKNKINSLQNSHSHGFQSSKDQVSKQFVTFKSSDQNSSRKELRGRIVKKFGSRAQPQFQVEQKRQRSPKLEQMLSDNSADLTPTAKGFTWHHPKVETKQQKQSYQKQIKNNHQTSEERNKQKRVDSSAIFRRNHPIPSRNNEQFFSQRKLSKTLQFNPQKEKIVIESQQTEEIFHKNKPISPIQRNNELDLDSLDIEVPQFHIYPHPQNTSQELVEIGKTAFTILGCQITEQTVLSVLKYRNCVLFSISSEENILWHYQGRFYFGGWKVNAKGEGEKYGEGLEFSPKKFKFKGLFSEGKRNGFGTLVNENGTIYMGQWKNGFKHGDGRQLDSEGFLYVGEWIEGKRDGRGKILFNGQIEFDGMFESGIKSGYGKEYFQNGDQYTGQFVNGKFHGQGTYAWKNGSTYVGGFQQGQRCGQGVWKSGEADGDRYEGQYLNDEKHGFGIYRWANGSVYEGEFKNDLKHGNGKITYLNGKTAQFYWNNGEVVKKGEVKTKFKTNVRPKKSQSSQKILIDKFKRLESGRSNTTEGSKFPVGVSKNQPQVKHFHSTDRFKSKSNKKGSELKSPSHYETNYSKPENKRKQGQQKVNNEAFLRVKLGNTPDLHTKSVRTGGPPRDPPYRPMQTTSNIQMNL